METKSTRPEDVPGLNTGTSTDNKSLAILLMMTSGIFTTGALINLAERWSRTQPHSYLDITHEVLGVLLVLMLPPVFVFGAKKQITVLTPNPDQQKAMKWVLLRIVSNLLMFASCAICFVSSAH